MDQLNQIFGYQELTTEVPNDNSIIYLLLVLIILSASFYASWKRVKKQQK